MSDSESAEQVRADGIDISFDLSGHTGRNRLSMFALKPAPVQVSWIGYPATTGLTAMDYYLVDKHFAPQGLLDDQFTEKLVRLPAVVTFEPESRSPERTEEQTSELQSLMRISYAVFCLKKKKYKCIISKTQKHE